LRFAPSIRSSTVDLPAADAADLKLGKVKNLTTQLWNAESAHEPLGDDHQTTFLTMCVGCHPLQRVFTATHDAPEYEQVFLRMALYAPGSTAGASAATIAWPPSVAPSMLTPPKRRPNISRVLRSVGQRLRRFRGAKGRTIA
jgi:hypothetical protein